MAKVILSSLLCLLFVGVAWAHFPTVIAEATQRPWRPSIKIDDSMIPAAREVFLEFESPKLNLELQKTAEGAWAVELTREQVALLLQEQDERSVPAELIYLHSTAKVSLTRDSKPIEVLVKKIAL